MHLQVVALVCLYIAQPFSCYEETKTDSNIIFEYLGINPKAVSNHKLTTIDEPRMHKRDLQQGTIITFQAIDEEISLWLRPRDSMLASDETPVYYAYYAPGYPNNVYFEKVDGAMKGVRELLEDPEHYATVILDTDDSGKTTVNGHLKSPRNDARLVISSLPKHIVEGFFNNRSSIDDLIDDSANLTYHVIVELSNNDDLQNIAKKGLRGAELDANATNNHNPDTLYPQILVQLDSLYYDQWSNKSVTFFLEYVLSFWNGVDLIYRQAQNPKIRFNIAGIIITTDFRATPYFWGNEIVENVSYDIDSVAGAASFFFHLVLKASPIVDFDAAVVMTKMYAIDRSQQNGSVIAGFAVGIGGICSRNDTTQQHEGVMVIRDNGAHEGIFTAAHEVGHSLGAQHEDESAHTTCTQMRDASLMEGGSSFTMNRTRLTSCALQDIRASFDKGALDCLYNVPQMTGTRLPGLMPGKIFNIVQQCEALGKGPPCFPNWMYTDVCYDFWCTPPDNAYSCEQMVSAASPGSVCLMENLTEHGICLKNRCVSVGNV